MNVIFDLDGTLIDSAPDLHAAAAHALKTEDLPPQTLAQTRSFIGNGVPKLVERVMAASGTGPDADRQTRMLAAFSAFYSAHPTTLTRLYPGVRGALERLAASGAHLAICTNKPHGPALAVLTGLDLARYFDGVIGGDSLPSRKPDPAMLFAARDGLGAGPTLYVGDSEVDAQTAQNAAIPFALYTEGYRKSEIDQIPHDAAFSDFADLAAVIEGLIPG